VFQRDNGAKFHLSVKAKGSQSCHRKTTTTECYPDPVNSGLSFSYRLHDLSTQSPLPTLRRDIGQVIIFPSDISRNIYAYISYPVPLVHLGLITYILCSDQLKRQNSTLHKNLSPISTYFLYLSQKQTSQRHTVSGQSLSTRFPLFFCGKKS
jgi:hypothetical protein